MYTQFTQYELISLSDNVQKHQKLLKARVFNLFHQSHIFIVISDGEWTSNVLGSESDLDSSATSHLLIFGNLDFRVKSL